MSNFETGSSVRFAFSFLLGPSSLGAAPFVCRYHDSIENAVLLSLGRPYRIAAQGIEADNPEELERIAGLGTLSQTAAFLGPHTMLIGQNRHAH
jgi:hypothetical protein